MGCSMSTAGTLSQNDNEENVISTNKSPPVNSISVFTELQPLKWSSSEDYHSLYAVTKKRLDQSGLGLSADLQCEYTELEARTRLGHPPDIEICLKFNNETPTLADQNVSKSVASTLTPDQVDPLFLTMRPPVPSAEVSVHHQNERESMYSPTNVSPPALSLALEPEERRNRQSISVRSADASPAADSQTALKSMQSAREAIGMSPPSSPLNSTKARRGTTGMITVVIPG
jgi:hypothetical protein